MFFSIYAFCLQYKCRPLVFQRYYQSIPLWYLVKAIPLSACLLLAQKPTFDHGPYGAHANVDDDPFSRTSLSSRIQKFWDALYDHNDVS